MKWLIVGGLILGSVLPVWRGAGHTRHDGVSFWRLLHDSTQFELGSPFGTPHIPYDEAYEQGFEDMRRRVPDITKASKMIAFAPTRTIDDILDELVDYFRQHERCAG